MDNLEIFFEGVNILDLPVDNHIELFEREIKTITNENFRDFVRYGLEKAPAYFWETGASASGKYHPAMSKGAGGLVRHVKSVCWFFEELSRLEMYTQPPELLDYGRIACIFHDIAKYGLEDKLNKKVYKDHAHNGGIFVNNCWQEYFGEDAPQPLVHAIQAHMGQWTEEQYRENELPTTTLDQLVHVADYVASRSFLDIPILIEEYNTIINE